MAITPNEINDLYEFGDYCLDRRKRLLMRGDESVSLTPKAIETLIVLIENRNRVVSKDELMKLLWPDSFVEEQNLSQNIFMLRKALGDSAQERRYILTVPGRGYQFTEKVREIGEEVREELVLERHRRSKVVIEQSKWRTRSLEAAALVVLLATAAVGFGYRSWRQRAADEKATQARNLANITPPVRRSVAILGFRNLSGRREENWLSTAFAEMLSTELAAGEQLRVLPGEQISRAKADLSLNDTETLAADSLSRLRDRLGADYVVLGAYTALGTPGNGRIRLDLRLQDAQAGETVVQAAVTGDESELFDLASDAGARLRESLDVGLLASQQALQIKASLPSNVTAARFYSEGLAKLRTVDALAARDLLEKAIAADPNHALSHSALAEAWATLGYVVKAQEEAKKAFDLSANLSREDRLLVEGRYRELLSDFSAAIKIYGTLRKLFPDDLEYALRLASAQSHGGSPKDALDTIARMRTLPARQSKDARIDLAEAKAAEHLGDFPLMQRAATAAVAKAQAQGSRLMMAQAKEQEGWAWGHLGDIQKALATYAQAQELATAANPDISAAILYGIATTLMDKGDYDASRNAYAESRKIYRQIGSRQNEAFATGGIGDAFFSQGNYTEARRYYEESLKVHSELQDPTAMGQDYGNLANAMADLGDLAQSVHLQEQSLQAFRQVGNKLGEMTTLASLASVQLDTGELDAARKTLDQAMPIAQQTGHEVIRGYLLFSQARLLLAQDRLAEAQSKVEEAIALREAHDEETLAAISRTQMAEVLLEQDKSPDAERMLPGPQAIFERTKTYDAACETGALRSRALLAQGKTADARGAIDHATRACRETSDYNAHYDISLAAADVDARTGKIESAVKELERVRADAHRHGFLAVELEARLRLGMLDLKSSKTVGANVGLANLQRDAQSKGFLLIARKAAATQRTQ